MEKLVGNFKQIREIYGATQDEIAKAIGINRTTVSQWETGSAKASSSNLEKLSLFYGIGPESFYELEELDDVRKQMLIDNSKKAKQVEEEAHGARNKAEELSKIFENITFKEAMQKYMFSMKLMLVAAELGELGDLKTAYQINEKMGKRLNAIIEIRDAEEKAKKENNEDTLFDLLENLSDSQKVVNRYI